MKIKNVSPLGDIVIPALKLTVKAGATFDVDDAAGARLLLQKGNFAPADKAAASAAVSPTADEPAEDKE